MLKDKSAQMRRTQGEMMKYAKFLALAATALAALMAFAGVASATTLTSPAGTTFTGTLKASSSNATLTNSSTIGTIKCAKSEVEGNVTKHGTGVTVFGDITKLTFTECTGGEPTDPVAKPGTLELHYTSGSNGTVTSSGAEVIIHKTLVGTCVFKTNNTDIGQFTGGTPAKLDIEGVIPQESSNFFCPPNATWSGTYTVTSPGTLLVNA
ncbi:MAG TPA: hypothetical protein VFJ61_13490 [Solirubrobacterales bacterium]|nr:hypothetical protein [Solirubrobacterales bacterium]